MAKENNLASLKHTINRLCSTKRKPSVNLWTLQFSRDFFRNWDTLEEIEDNLRHCLDDESISLNRKKEALECLRRVSKLLIYYMKLYDEYENECDTLIGDIELAKHNKPVCGECYLFNSPIEQEKELRLIGRDQYRDYSECVINKYKCLINKKEDY